ncbi:MULTISPECIES: helix-turn-helix domain-containing protein [Rhodococcus]|uniref:helix-turn-helix domain-containing protein n=1 Tax=Rhodococcus TaxID=1827 RepID=UPI0009FD938B|nr:MULTISPECIES: helix-turn-helix transcriptional regulator [Rhodococcus]
MARSGIHNTADLAQRLREYGIELSPSQMYRLVTQTPGQSLPRVLAALCASFACELEDLLTFTYAEQTPRRVAIGTSVIDPNSVGGPGSSEMTRADVESGTPAGGRPGRPRRPGTRDCDRCPHSARKIAARWPDGAICCLCHSSATRTHGTCPGSSAVRCCPDVTQPALPSAWTAQGGLRRHRPRPH